MMSDASSATIYRDATQPVADRVEDLLGRMTLDEKVAQLTGILPFDLLGPAGLSKQLLEQHLSDGLGEVSAGGLLSPDPAALIPALGQIQRFLVEQTRLGIPAIFHQEALAGVVHAACQDFPTAISLAASWDPPSVEAMNDLVRRQMRALGLHQACSPNLDIARDARWGRVQETYGEDPYLASAIGVAFIRGLQGEDRREGVLATAKHFLGYGMADGGRNIGTVQLGERDLLEVQARPFGAAIAEAGLESVMCAYSDVNGEPAAASRHLLTDILRGALGFAGMTVADYGAVNALYTRQQTATDEGDAGVQALRPGSTSSSPARSATGPAWHRRSVTGCSTRPSSTTACGSSSMPSSGSACSRARTATWTRSRRRRQRGNVVRRRPWLDGSPTRSTVLLANPNGLLPLPRELARVAVIGPNAHSIRNLFGGYSAPQQIEMMTSGDMGLPAPVQGGEVDDEVMAAVAPTDPDEPKDTGQDFGYVRRIAERPSEVALAAIDAVYGDTPTVLRAIEATVSDATEVVYALGCHVNDPSHDGIPEAVAAATGSDVAILVLGDKTGLVSDAVVGETRDRTTLELAGAQRPLLQAVCATGVPVVVVLLGSQPVPVYAEEGGPQAVINGYQPGSIGGVAIADVLFGLENPSGRVPITIPRTAGQCPIFHGYKHGTEPGTYTDLEDSGPAYPFGHGLSYTSFDYRSITVDTTEAGAEGTVHVSVEVANTGDRAGEEVVQLYAEIQRRGVTRPVRELVGFDRVSLEAGEAATVTFALEPAILAYYDVGMNLVVTPGDVHLMAGPSSAVLPLTTAFTITGEPLEQTVRTVHLTRSSVIRT